MKSDDFEKMHMKDVIATIKMGIEFLAKIRVVDATKENYRRF